MKILFVWNGLTHYFNLITSQINQQPGVEIIYVSPLSKSVAMGEGVFETKDGANFQIVELEEKVNNIYSLYFEGLVFLIKEIKPDIIMVTEAHVQSLMFDDELKKIIGDQKIKIILKSIPFQVKKYDEFIKENKAKLKEMPLPPFNSFPASIRKVLKFSKADLLYKKLVLDKKSFMQLIKYADFQKEVFNFPNAHVNYIENAYDIFCSYGVPKEKIFITYNSPDTDLYFAVKAKIMKEEAILPCNKFRIIHLSRLVEWKRVDMLITAVANLKREYPEIELLIIGEGPEREKLTNQALSLNIQDSVKFLGGIYDIELLGKYLISSSIYILAGMGGLSINDAMIFGLPVICAVCDGTEKHLVRENYNGLYFVNGNQESLEEKITYLFKNPELCKKMGDNSVKIIKEEINIHTVVKGYMKAFEYVLTVNN